MTSPLTPIRQWYAALEARKLAALTPELREEVLAFDASMRRHKWRMLAASFAIWMAAAAAFQICLQVITLFMQEIVMEKPQLHMTLLAER